MKIILTLALLLLLTACSSREVSEAVAEIAIEAIADVDISHNALHCPTVKNNCGVNGNYQEWYQENGQLACACNN
jgi:hypothetical protein